MPFQASINIQPALAVAGDFAGANPTASALSGSGAFVAGVAGLAMGLFCWHDVANDNALNNYGPGAPCGFVRRSLEGQILDFTAESGGIIRAGQEANAFIGGAFWAKNDGATAAVRGHAAFAQFGTGKVRFGPAGTPLAGAAFTGVISASVLTVSSLTGTVRHGQPLTGTGVTAGTYIGTQITGTPGGTGTYNVVGTTTASSTAMTTLDAYETKWRAASNAAAGELVKMSSIAEG